MTETIDRHGTFVPCSSLFGAASIDVGDDEDVACWCERLSVTEQRLRAAVGKVGPMANAVHAYLGSRGLASHGMRPR